MQATTARLLSVRAVSETLDCCPRTVYRLIHRGALPAFRMSNPHGHWRVTPEALESFQITRQWTPAGRAKVA